MLPDRQDPDSPSDRGTAWSLLTSDGALVCAVLALMLSGFLFAEKIEIGEGLGWDGQFYGECARDFHGQVVERGIDGSIGRVLPSAVAHYSLRLFGVPLTYPHIIRAFGLVNVALVTLSAFLWCRIADELKISRRGKWFGATGLFVSFGVLKWFSYYPVLTDAYAFAVGMLILYCYLVDRRFALGALTVIGGSFWPMLLCHGIPLLLFPVSRHADTTGGAPRFRLNTLLAAAVALATGAFFVRLLRRGDFGFQADWLASYCHANLSLWQPFGLAALVSAACVALYWFLALKNLWDRDAFFKPAYWLDNLWAKALLAVVLLVLAVRWLDPFPTKSTLRYGMHDLVLMFAWQSIRLPGLPCLAHAVFFGPILILALLCWKQVCRAMHPYGLGLTLCVTANLFLSIDTESRHFLHFFPLVVAFVVKSLDNLEWRTPQYAVFALLAFVFSKIWLPIDGSPDASAGAVERFPSQLFFMNLGPWMSRQMYLIQAAAVLVSGGLLYVVLLRGRQSFPAHRVTTGPLPGTAASVDPRGSLAA